MLQRKSVWLQTVLSLILLIITGTASAQRWNPGHSIGTTSGKYGYQNGQVPDQLVEIYPATVVPTSLDYQWESSFTFNEDDFEPVSGGTQSSLSPGRLTRTIYYRRKTIHSSGLYVYSNIIKLSIVSASWEDRTYIREYDIRVKGITTAGQVDQLPIGGKMQSTTYMDGLGRGVEKVSRETATPSQAGGLWGDIVQFLDFNEFGLEDKKYLPYTTTTESGKFKTAPKQEQEQYYANLYNESHAFTAISYERNPLNRASNVKAEGATWGVANGNSSMYDLNSDVDNVQIWALDYVKGNSPVKKGVYAPNTLFKIIITDENNKQHIEYNDKSGQLILKKVQIDDAPSPAHAGWICTYYVYDDLGLLRYQLQPEAVKYLDANNWSFTGENGAKVLSNLCYQYYYDDKGRNTWKKAPGAEPITMLYDARDRLVFAQDGNQAVMPTPQWTASLYDQLDRHVITALYNTTKTTAELQTAVNNVQTGPISEVDLGNPNITTIVKHQFYDDYSFASAKPFNTGFTNLSAYSTADPNVMPIAASKRTIGLETGSLTRVLGTGTFLAATQYYDEDEQPIQLLEDNIKGGTEISTLQYHFDGRVLSSCSDHTAPGTGYTNFITLTKYDFDKLGRVTAIEKKYGSNAFKTVSTYDYDDVGRVKTKHFDPTYTAEGKNELESLNYSFNILDKITGINKEYALKNPSVYDKWQHFFGMYLGYDNRDNIFANRQMTGQLAGVIWNTQGDDAQRKYDYTYDNAGRLTSAVFTEQKHAGEGWSANKMDFSVTGTSGKITYDLNSNLVNMLHKGVLPGQTAPLTIDELNYTYETLSNKLQNVTDVMTNTNLNGKSGDFKDGSNGAQPDYVYDKNGNLVIDLNKDIKELAANSPNGISYNYLDKPELIRIAGKGTIKIVYSADGDKLKRTFTPESGTATTITYINEFVYEAVGNNPDSLAFINFEEGRIRVIQPQELDNGIDILAIGGNFTLPNGKAGVYDYYIKDYLNNIRMVLTEETHSAANTCTMETDDDRDTIEEAIFGQSGGANEVAATRHPAPAAWDYADKKSFVSRLGNVAGHNIGPNSLQKVMAGDKVTAHVKYFYQNATGGSNPAFVTTLLTSLAQAITGSPIAGNVVKSNVTGITSGLSGTSGFIDAVKPSETGGTTPRAYLTMLFFDERFNFIEATDGGVWQQQVESTVGSGGLPLGLGNIKAPKNGYVYVYVSNQSDQDVYFDNFMVGISRGNIIEENHYYAYGLKIAAISSRKPGDVNDGKIKNDYLYNGKELFEEGDLDWYDYGFRNYDPQIGRFVQMDPLTDDFPILSPYLYANCDPVNEVDVEGLFGGIATTADKATELAAVYVVAKKATKAVAGKIVVHASSIAIKGAAAGANAVNKSAGTPPAGGGFFDGLKNGAKSFFGDIGEALSNPGETLSNAFSLTSLAENALNASTFGGYGQGKELYESTQTIVEKGAYGAGEIIGRKGAEVAFGLVTEKAGQQLGALGKAARGTKIASKATQVADRLNKVYKKVPCGCFVAGTMILTDRGLVQVQDIKVGDQVWAYNDTTGAYDLKRVKQLFTYTRDTIYAVSIGNEVINTTSDHPFFVFGKWVRVHELKAGDSLQTYTGQKIAINSITVIPGQRSVYNFEVEDYHTYYVSGQKVLVHNAGPCKTKLPEKTIVQQDGVTIEHYYKSGDHAPAHAHVKGGGKSTKIGQNGKPIEGSPELSARQQAVVDMHKAKIRRAMKKIMKFHRPSPKK